MATNQTEHYGLSQWEPEDSFLREEFNEDFRKIDGAIAAKSDVVFGSYVGSGSGDQEIELGFPPKGVIVDSTDGGRGSLPAKGGMFGPDCPLLYSKTAHGEVTETGFRVRGGLNYKVTYYYMAVR